MMQDRVFPEVSQVVRFYVELVDMEREFVTFGIRADYHGRDKYTFSISILDFEPVFLVGNARFRDSHGPVAKRTGPTEVGHLPLG